MPHTCIGCGDDVDITDGSAYAHHGDASTVDIYCSRDCFDTPTGGGEQS